MPKRLVFICEEVEREGERNNEVGFCGAIIRMVEVWNKCVSKVQNSNGNKKVMA